MSDWQCSRCFMTYSFDEFMNLEMQWLNENEKKFGKTKICKCGKSFHKDKWMLKTRHKLGYIVSTVHLEIAHTSNIDFFSDEIMWYETMIFPDDKKGKDALEFQVRYPTQKSAINGHILTYKMLPKIAENPENFPQDIISKCMKVLGHDEYKEEKEEFQNSIFRKEKKN